MSTNAVEKVRGFLKGIGDRDPVLATENVNAGKYVEHNPNVSGGVESLKDFVNHLPHQDHSLNVVRVLQDGDFVLAHSEGLILNRGAFFDLFRFEDGLIVEHWNFSAKAAPPNKSGHSQTDGPIQVRDLAETEQNKAVVRNYYETIHISGDHGKIPLFFYGDNCIRHEPGVSDGVANFKRDLKKLVKDRSIKRIKFLFGQGNFVFIAADGSADDAPCIYLDMYRVENEQSLNVGDFQRRSRRANSECQWPAITRELWVCEMPVESLHDQEVHMFEAIHWPAEMAPSRCPIHFTNELQVAASPETIWSLLIDTKAWPSFYPGVKDVRLLGVFKTLTLGARFETNLAGQDVAASVPEFEPMTRIAWYGGPPTSEESKAYHAWILTPTPKGCHLWTEETMRGPLWIELAKKAPDAFWLTHEKLLANLARVATERQDSLHRK